MDKKGGREVRGQNKNKTKLSKSDKTIKRKRVSNLTRDRKSGTYKRKRIYVCKVSDSVGQSTIIYHENMTAEGLNT